MLFISFSIGAWFSTVDLRHETKQGYAAETYPEFLHSVSLVIVDEVVHFSPWSDVRSEAVLNKPSNSFCS